MMPSSSRGKSFWFICTRALADQDEPEPRESEPRGSRVADPPVLEPRILAHAVGCSTRSGDELSVHGDGDGPADEVAVVVDELHGDQESPAAALGSRRVVQALGHAQAASRGDLV